MADRPASTMRKCASVPSLCLRKDSDCETEVYVTTRMLEELSSKIPKRFQGLVLDLGVAHYMVGHSSADNLQLLDARQRSCFLCLAKSTLSTSHAPPFQVLRLT